MTLSLDQALALFVLMLVAQVPILIAAWAAYIKSKAAIDENTRLTKDGTDAAKEQAKEATVTAEKAVGVAADTKSVVDGMSKKLNGGIDEAIRAAITPVHETLAAHTKQDAQDLQEVKDKFDQLTEYVHERNHDMLNVVNNVATKLEVLTEIFKMTKEYKDASANLTPPAQQPVPPTIGGPQGPKEKK